MTVRESDWKTFRKLREIALERFRQRVMDDCVQLCSDSNRSLGERYAELYALVPERDRDIQAVFDGHSRTSMRLQLAGMYVRDLLTEEELGRFSEEMREYLRGFD